MSECKVYALSGIDRHAGVQTGYVLAQDGVALLVDAACSRTALDMVLADADARLAAILLTHSHFDHSIYAHVLRQYAPIYAHPNTARMLSDGTWLAGFANYPTPTWRPDCEVHDGQILQFGPFRVQVIETPGHTIDSVCYLINDAYLAGGDTVMSDIVCGTADLPTGNLNDLMASGQKLWRLCADDVRILGGHVSRPDRKVWAPYSTSSTVGKAKKRNWINHLDTMQ